MLRKATIVLAITLGALFVAWRAPLLPWHVEESTTIDAPLDAVSVWFREIENWPQWQHWFDELYVVFCIAVHGEESETLTLFWEDPEVHVNLDLDIDAASGDGGERLLFELYNGTADFGTSFTVTLTPDGSRTRVHWQAEDRFSLAESFREPTLQAIGEMLADELPALAGMIEAGTVPSSMRSPGHL